jgi:hypothetical protein
VRRSADTVRREKEQAMENNDRQQDGGNFGEAKEDVFVDLFAGEAVSEDSGHSDWGEDYSNFLQEKLS